MVARGIRGGIMLNIIIEIALVVALLYGYAHEEAIARWEQDKLVPFIEKALNVRRNDFRKGGK